MEYCRTGVLTIGVVEMKLLFAFFGKLEECADRDGIPYPAADWRSAYVGMPGLIVVYESERKATGKKFIYFFPDFSDDLDWRAQDWLRTSAGELLADRETYTITTRNSRYVFVWGDDALPVENKLLLCLNTGITPPAASEDEETEN